ncbi:unnamed protein product [Amoebophrya sp. A120]|nr:unnamed protein product [Amoebophrya sp. A120]|eukprot:GSA120T00021725001.1
MPGTSPMAPTGTALEWCVEVLYPSKPRTSKASTPVELRLPPRISQEQVLEASRLLARYESEAWQEGIFKWRPFFWSTLYETPPAWLGMLLCYGKDGPRAAYNRFIAIGGFLPGDIQGINGSWALAVLVLWILVHIDPALFFAAGSGTNNLYAFHWMDLVTLLTFRLMRACSVGMKYGYFNDSELAVINNTAAYGGEAKMVARRLGASIFFDDEGVFEYSLLEQLFLASLRAKCLGDLRAAVFTPASAAAAEAASMSAATRQLRQSDVELRRAWVEDFLAQTEVMHDRSCYERAKKQCLFQVDYDYARVGKFGDLERLLNLTHVRGDEMQNEVDQTTAEIRSHERVVVDSEVNSSSPTACPVELQPATLPVGAFLYALTCRAYRPLPPPRRGPPNIIRFLLFSYLCMFLCGCCTRKLQYGVWFGDSDVEIWMGVGRYLTIATHNWVILLYASYPVMEMGRRLRLAKMLLAVFGDALALAELEQKHRKRRGKTTPPPGRIDQAGRIDTESASRGNSSFIMSTKDELLSSSHAAGKSSSAAEGVRKDQRFSVTSFRSGGTTLSSGSSFGPPGDSFSSARRRGSKFKEVLQEVNASADLAGGDLIVGTEVLERHLSLQEQAVQKLTVASTVSKAVVKFKSLKKASSNNSKVYAIAGARPAGDAAAVYQQGSSCENGNRAGDEEGEEALGRESKDFIIATPEEREVGTETSTRKTDLHTEKMLNSVKSEDAEDWIRDESRPAENAAPTTVDDTSPPEPDTYSDYEFIALHPIGVASTSDLIALHTTLKTAGTGTFFLNFGTRYSSAFALNIIAFLLFHAGLLVFFILSTDPVQGQRGTGPWRSALHLPVCVELGFALLVTAASTVVTVTLGAMANSWLERVPLLLRGMQARKLRRLQQLKQETKATAAEHGGREEKPTNGAEKPTNGADATTKELDAEQKEAEEFVNYAEYMIEDILMRHEIEPIRFLYMRCTYTVLQVMYSLISVVLSSLVSALFTRGYMSITSTQTTQNRST